MLNKAKEAIVSADSRTKGILAMVVVYVVIMLATVSSGAVNQITNFIPTVDITLKDGLQEEKDYLVKQDTVSNVLNELNVELDTKDTLNKDKEEIVQQDDYIEITRVETKTVEKIEKIMAADDDIKVVAMVFHETSTGMINPVKEVGKVAAKYGKWFFVDCVSAAAGELIDVVDMNITFATSVGGKCLGAYPGSAYVCGKIDALETLTPEMGKNVYLNLAKHYIKAKTDNQTPNTPNVNLFWALRTALDNALADGGVEARVARYKECAGILRKGMKDMGLKFLIEDDAKMASTVTSVFLPEGKDLKQFLADMEAKGYVVYSGKGKFEAMGMFQVANMGEIYPADCEEFLEVLKGCLA